ncbi:hypothetical protein [Paenibacillus sp. GXUN7292]|uniref:hypothetical protein n=1 Tax=Paenibacillus sp. GXUN7292 TaxID=3422499 RepID=UPI003D7D243F
MIIFFKKIIDVIKTEPAPKGEGHFLFKVSEKYNQNLFIYTSDRITFNKTCAEIWESDRKVYESVSLETFSDELINFLEDFIFTEKTITEKDVSLFLGKFILLPNIEWLIIKPLYGAEFDDKTDPIELGDFVIYKKAIHKDLISLQSPYIDSSTIWDELDSEYTDLLITTTVTSRYSDLAVSIAEVKFNEFENVMRYMIGRQTIFNVSVLDTHSMRENHTYIFSEANALRNISSQGVFSNIQLNNYFISEQNGNNSIWEKMKLSSKTDIDRRIISAVIWIGKGLKEKDYTNSFIQYIFALEALFMFQSKNVLVNPSIANQLAEFSSFILGSDVESRMDVMKKVKSMYQIRSAIAHGGAKNVTLKDSIDSYRLIKRILTSLLTDPELKLITNIENLQKWVDNKKFS